MSDGGLGLVPTDAAPDNDPGGPAALPASPFEALRRRRQKLFDARDREFVVPGYENVDIGDLVADLVARYRRLDVEDFREALFGPAEGTVERNATFLIDSLQGLFWRVGTEDGGTRLIPLLDGEDAGWHDLVAQLQLDLPADADAVDQLVIGVFAGNEVAMTDHAGDVGRWMQAGHTEADLDFLGGS